MNNLKKILEQSKDLFIVPVMPTPNGRMHLGHISGPYLKMDILKRKAKRNGKKAFMVSGSDSYESYVELKASQLNISPTEVADKFHDLIIKDFRALDIEMDIFFNPLSDEHKKSFRSLQLEMLQDLIDKDCIEYITEEFPYDNENKRPLTGCWLSGKCPTCGESTGSYLCENCGSHYKPMDIFNGTQENVSIVSEDILYVKFNEEKLEAKLKEMAVPQSVLEIFENYVASQGNKIKITTLQNTGVELGNQVIFTYTALWFFSVYCGELVKKEFDLELNPFDKESNFTTLASFGFDTTIPYTIGVLGTAQNQAQYKSYDNYLFNYFYYLENKKFSTSREHVIWSDEIVNTSKISSDAIRYYLAKEGPEKEARNFDISNFLGTLNIELFYQYNDYLREIFSLLKLNSKYELDDELSKKIEAVVIEQNDYLSLKDLDLNKNILLLNKWIEDFTFLSQEDKLKYSYWWLKTHIFLMYPFMPQIAMKIWKKLSSSNEITIDTLFTDNMVIDNNVADVLFKEISLFDLEKSLPKTLKTQQ